MKEKKEITKGNIRIKPLHDRVLIKEDKDTAEQTQSGIYIPSNIKEDKGSKKGKVIAVGQGRIEDGKRIPVDVQVGDVVLFSWGDKITSSNEEFYIVRESEIIAIIN